MTVLCLGTSHHTAPVDFLEQALQVAGEVHERFVAEVSGAHPARYAFDELAVLGTCNRLELYAAVHEDRVTMALDGLRGDLLDGVGLPAGHRWEDVFYVREGADAVRHLSRVAAGLDSLVVGEHEIAGQVARAFDGVVRRTADGCVLTAVGEAARAAGRRARAETAIGRGPASIASVAVGLVREACNDLTGSRVVVVGAGKMGRLAAQSFTTLGPSRILLIGRSPDRTNAAAESVGVQAGTPEDLPGALESADVLLTSTSSPDIIVDADMVRAAGRGAQGSQPLIVVDVAVPRDVDPEVGHLPGVRLFDIDDLRDRIARHLEERRSEIPRAEAIVTEEVAAYEQRVLQARMRPLISALRSQAESIRHHETERVLAELEALGDFGPGVRDRLEHFSRTLVDRLLREPTERLRDSPDHHHAETFDRVTRELFGLESEDTGSRSAVG